MDAGAVMGTGGSALAATVAIVVLVALAVWPHVRGPHL